MMCPANKDAQRGKMLLLRRKILVEAAGIEPASASPLPQALHVYSVYCFNCRLPDEQGTPTAIPRVFNRSAPDWRHCDLVRYDA